jgi:hypothetical protein
MKLGNFSLVRLLAMASLVAAAPLGCAHEGGEGSPDDAGTGSGADELVARVVFNQAVVKADSIEFPRSVVPARVLRRIEAYQQNVTPKRVARTRRDVFGKDVTEEVVDVDDLLAQERAFVARGGERVILFGDRQDSVKPGERIDEAAVTNPSGYLRRALSYELRGETVVVATSVATLEDYFKDLELGEELIGPQQDGLGVRRAPLTVPFNFNLADIQNKQIFAANGTVDTPLGPANGDASLTVKEAKLDVSGQLDVGLKLGFFKLKEAHVKLEGGVAGAVEFEALANGSFSTATGDVKLLDRPVKFALPAAGPVPLTLQVDLTAKCNLDANGNARASVGGDLNANVAVGFQFEKGDLKNIGQAPSFNVSLREPELSINATANARCAVVPELKVLMFDSLGPSIAVEAFADAKFAAGAAFGAEPDASASAQVKVGADFLVGGELKTPLFNFQLIDFGTAKVLGLESDPQTFTLR